MPKWYSNSRVIRVGATETGDVLIFLQRDHPEPGEQLHAWYTAVSAARREMLSTALTAIATGYKVEVELEKPEQFSLIYKLYVSLG